MNIFIGGAWPYANGSLHLGRVAGLLPGDVLARYYRLKGEDVLYVSGSDCHGTPIAIQAEREGVSPRDIAERYHQEFEACFAKLGFSYDLYTRTDEPHHHQAVQKLFLRLLDNEVLYRKTVEQSYCQTCVRFLPDRYVEGSCPHCGQIARGDQCDACSALLEPTELINRSCKICGNPPITRETEHLFLALSRLQSELTAYSAQHESEWRDNAVKLTKRYLAEGLQDRAVTRDLDWGVDVPSEVEGFEGKKIYVWLEAVCGYWTASTRWAELTGRDWQPFWSEHAVAYYVHGKDNIPFHTLIWPAALLGDGRLHLPDRVLSSEYLTLEGRKFSTSRNWAVWLPDLLERYDPDSIRYFLLINGPEKRDADFSWRAFIHSHNGELLGAFGNFVNRNLKFVEKAYGGVVPQGRLDAEKQVALKALYGKIGKLVEAGEFKEALEQLFAFVRASNKYVEDRKPWANLQPDPQHAADTLYTCVQITANLSSLLEPFVPFACAKIRRFLSIAQPSWSFCEVQAGQILQDISILFERIDVHRIEEENERLRSLSQ